VRKQSYLHGGGAGDELVGPHVVDPVDDDEDAAHGVEQRHQRPQRRREDAERADDVLRQDLAGEQEQVRRRGPHRGVVAAREPAQDVRQRQEQTHRGANHHVHLKQPSRTNLQISTSIIYVHKEEQNKNQETTLL
jgi:hypothetical protein